MDEKKTFKFFKEHGFVDRYNEKHGNIIKQYAIQDCLDLVMPGADICYAEQSRIVNSYDDINKHVLAKPFKINSNTKTKIKFQNDTYFAISPHLGEHVITENLWKQLPNVSRKQAMRKQVSYVQIVAKGHREHDNMVLINEDSDFDAMIYNLSKLFSCHCTWLSAALLIYSRDKELGKQMVDLMKQDLQKYEWLYFSQNKTPHHFFL